VVAISARNAPIPRPQHEEVPHARADDAQVYPADGAGAGEVPADGATSSAGTPAFQAMVRKIGGRTARRNAREMAREAGQSLWISRTRSTTGARTESRRRPGARGRGANGARVLHGVIADFKTEHGPQPDAGGGFGAGLE